MCPPTRAECDVAKYKRAACTADNCDALEAIAHSIVHEAQDGLCVPAGEKRSRLMKMCAETECARSETGDVSKDAMWAHMDIAGPVWNDKMGGATGYGVRTLVGLVESMDA